MSFEPTVAAESKLVRRSTPWLRRLWVRISLVLVLIGAISLWSFWWPRRGAFAVRWAHGTIMSHEDFQRQRQLRSSGWMPGRKWTLDEQLELAQWLSWFRLDASITWLDVSQSKSPCLIPLRRFPSLTYAHLHDRQLDSALEELNEHHDLTWIGVTAARERHLAGLQRLPYVTLLELFSPSANNLDLSVLEPVPTLTDLTIRDCVDVCGIVRQLGRLKRLRLIDLEQSMGIADDEWEALADLPDLRHLVAINCSGISDVGLIHLSKLERLESLVLTGSIGRVSDEGICALGKLKNLTQLVVSGTQVSSAQVESLRQALLNCVITVR